jgi:hypothetical protein
VRVMECSFSFEAKAFCISAKDGYPNFQLEERRKGFVGYIFTSIQCSLWLVDMVEAVIQGQVKEEIAKTFHEGDKATMLHEGGNKARRFLEVSVMAESGRKGVIWLPEGHFGRGWRHFARELRHLLAAQSKLPIRQSMGLLPRWGLSWMLLFRGSSCLELESDGLGVRSAVDCSVLESLSTPLAVAARSVSSRKKKGKIGISRLLRLLGQIQHKLDRVRVGLASKHNRRRKSVRFLDLTKSSVGWVLGSDQNSGPGQY